MITKSKKSRSVLRFVILCIIASTFLFSEIASSAIVSSPYNQTIGDQLKDSAIENLHLLEDIDNRRNFSTADRSLRQKKGYKKL